MNKNDCCYIFSLTDPFVIEDSVRITDLDKNNNVAKVINLANNQPEYRWITYLKYRGLLLKAKANSFYYGAHLINLNREDS